MPTPSEILIHSFGVSWKYTGLRPLAFVIERCIEDPTLLEHQKTVLTEAAVRFGEELGSMRKNIQAVVHMTWDQENERAKLEKLFRIKLYKRQTTKDFLEHMCNYLLRYGYPEEPYEFD